MDRTPMTWLKGQKDPDSIKAKLKSSKDILDILDEIIVAKKLKASSGCKPDWIDSAWPYRAADLNGYLRALEEIQRLLP